jgi:hypothetical protein
VTDQPLTEDQQLLMLHEVPGNLSGEQSAGQVCVWCLTPYGPLADLGGVGDWRPRGCESCRAARLDCLHTYWAWLQHTEQCGRCGAFLCGEGQELAQRHCAARDHAGKVPHAWCVKCHQRMFLARSRAIPVLFEGNTATYPRYKHAGPCPPIRERGAGVLREV